MYKKICDTNMLILRFSKCRECND